MSRGLSGALAALVVGAACAAVGCGSSLDQSSGSSKDNNKQFSFVVVGGTTGPFATNVAQVLDGAQLATDYLNQHGGIDGRKIKMTVLNSQGDPATAVSVLQKYLAGNPKPDAVYAGVTSTETLAILPMLTRQKVYSFSNTNNPQLNDPKKWPYHFGGVPTAVGQLAGLPDELRKLGAKRLGVLVPNDAFGKGEAETVEAAAKQAGFAVSTRTYDPTAVDLTVPYQAVLSKHPDAMFIDGADVQEARVLSARAKVGASKLPTFGGSGFTTKPPNQVAKGAAVANLRIPVEAGLKYEAPSTWSPAKKNLLEQGGFTDPSPKYPSAYIPAIAYDGLRLTAMLAAKAGSTDADALKGAAEAFKAAPSDELVTQTTRSFSPTDHFPGTPFAWIPAATESLDSGMFRAAG
jgi:branched-chain amino acid transport system substrate-binding protein